MNNFIVINERDDSILKINEQIIDIWKSKFRIKKEINKIKKIKTKKSALNINLDDFKVNKLFISSFLKGLWNHPELMYEIIINTDNDVIKKNLATFIVNDFYCNYLSGNYIENNLLYIITLMLKDEIDRLENINQANKFLENTKCSFLLEELQKMPDIQIFFKKVILKTVENIEKNCSNRKISFNISEKQKEFIKLKEAEEKKLGKKNEKNLEEIYARIVHSKVIDQSLNYSSVLNSKKCKDKSEIFTKKYIPDIRINDFENRAENANNKNNNLFEYYNKFANEIKSNNNKDFYSNSTLIKNLFKSKYSTYLLTFYQNDFLDIISFIEQLLKDLIENILLLPNSVKIIFKIIFILIKNKFKNITKIEENSFISKFVLEKLLIPIFSNPNSKALITEFIISENTIKNIESINFILSKLFSGKLFINNIEEGEYTPFNWFFLDKMENIFLFFEEAVNIKLPSFLEKYVNNNLPENYLYDFFNENKEEIYSNISICFTVENLINLLIGLEKSSYFVNNMNPNIIKFKKSYEKLFTKGTINEIKNTDKILSNQHKEKVINKKKNKDKEKDKDKHHQNIEIENYYIYNSYSIENKYEKFFSINNKIANFYIDIKKVDKNIEEKEKNIIKVKNYLCSSLGNYRLLNKSDFSPEAIYDTKKMLEEIKTYMTLPNFILNNNTIPSTWYINSILDYLNKIPEDYKENDYKKLFNELIQNLNESINILDFEKLIIFRNKTKFIDKMCNYYDNVKLLIKNITFNEKIKTIVEQEFIPVDINFIYDDKEKKFELKKSKIKESLFEDKIIYEEPKKKLISFRTIEAFTRYFPNLTLYQLLQGINPIDIIKELSINELIINYLEIVKEKISKKMDMNQYENLYKEKIRDYIMNKIYDKIYPPEPDDYDRKIFKKANQLSWVEPYLIVEKDYIYDNLLPDILNEFKKFSIVKSPFQKLNCIQKIIDYIINLIKFNEGIDKVVGADDINPVLNYVFIKAHPFRIFSDIEFIKIFLEDYGENNFNLTNFESMYTIILNSKAETFKITPEEYNRKCIDAANENNNRTIF